MIKSPRIWLITGVSGGLGRALALEVAQNGDIVYGTLRKTEQLEAFNELVPGKTFGTILDVNQHQDIPAVLDGIIKKEGRIDVLVNNAGYGLMGAVEEVSMDEARKQMETNFFSVMAVTQAVLPFMRKQGSGKILQVSSMSGVRAYAGTGLYNASKFALEGLSEALALEVRHLNIDVILIEPGPFRTEWAGASSFRAKNVIKDYDASSGERLKALQNISGNQPGDPVKAAKAIIIAVNSETPPLRLVLGQVALNALRERSKSVEEEYAKWEEVSVNTAFD